MNGEKPSFWRADKEARIVAADKELLDFFGFTTADLPFPVAYIQDRVHPEDQWKFRAGRRDRFNQLVRTLRHDGAWRLIQHTGFVVTKPGGEYDGLTGTSYDITNHKCAIAQPEYNTVMRRLGRNIKRTREMMGYSQKQVAEILGITQTALSHLERGKKNPTVGNLIRLAETLGVPLNCFFEEI